MFLTSDICSSPDFGIQVSHRKARSCRPAAAGDCCGTEPAAADDGGMAVYGHFAIPEILCGPNAAIVLLGDGCDWYIHNSAIVNHFDFFEVGKYWM